MYLVPSLVHQIVNHRDVHRYDLSSITTVGCGAAYLPPELGDKLLRLTPATLQIGEGAPRRALPRAHTLTRAPQATASLKWCAPPRARALPR